MAVCAHPNISSFDSKARRPFNTAMARVKRTTAYVIPEIMHQLCPQLFGLFEFCPQLFEVCPQLFELFELCPQLFKLFEFCPQLFELFEFCPQLFETLPAAV